MHRNYLCHFAESTHFYFTKAGGRKMGLGVGVNGHAHRYVLILPLFFGVEASLWPTRMFSNRFIVAMELYPFLMKRLLMNLFQDQFAPLHYASPMCIMLHEKCTPTMIFLRFGLVTHKWRNTLPVSRHCQQRTEKVQWPKSMVSENLGTALVCKLYFYIIARLVIITSHK